MRSSDAFRGLYHRSRERVFCQEWQWFIDTREGRRGPFSNRNSAQQELSFFIDTMAFIEKNRATLPDYVELSDVELVNMDRPVGWIGASWESPTTVSLGPVRSGPQSEPRDDGRS